MSKNLNLLLQGHSSFSPSKISSQNLQLNKINNLKNLKLSCIEYYALTVTQDFSSHAKLLNLLNAVSQSKTPNFFIGPRAGTISPWSSKTKEIIDNVSIQGVHSIERYFGYFLEGSTEEEELIITNLFDRMTQEVFYDQGALSNSSLSLQRRTLKHVDLSKSASHALVKANIDLGLALSQGEIAYLVDFYSSVERNPTDAELMMFAQANSEHCRHKIFNATWVIDSVAQDQSLFDLIKETSKGNKPDLISAYKDNAAVIEGTEVQTLNRNLENQYTFSNEKLNSTLKVETHNHPTAISPFPGAATGSGGEIRDEGATGTGAKPKMGLVGFNVSNLRLERFPRAWESTLKKPERIATPLQIMTEGPIGAAAFNNEFGRPSTVGYFRVFEKSVTDQHAYGYHKPIMLAGGVGEVKDRNSLKNSIQIIFILMMKVKFYKMKKNFFQLF